MCANANKCLSEDFHQILYGWKSPTADWVLIKKFKKNKMLRTQILITLLLVRTVAINAYVDQDTPIKSTLLTGATTGLYSLVNNADIVNGWPAVTTAVEDQTSLYLKTLVCTLVPFKRKKLTRH